MTVFHRGLADDRSIYFSAELDGAVIGFCSLIIRNSLWQENHIGYICELVVDKSFRCKGIGSELMEKAMDSAKKSGCKRIELDSEYDNIKAHTFYEKLGLEKRAYQGFVKNL